MQLIVMMFSDCEEVANIASPDILKSLKMRKGLSEALNQRKNHTVAKRKDERKKTINLVCYLYPQY